MDHVMVTRCATEPPTRPLVLNGVLYDQWLNVETGRHMKWDGEKWEKVDHESSKVNNG